MRDQIEKDTRDENEPNESAKLGRAPRRLGLMSLSPVRGVVLPIKSGVHAGAGNKIWQDDWLAPI